MLSEIEFAAQRFGSWAAEVIAPALYAPGVPLEVGVHQSPDPIPPADAPRQTYAPVAVGWRWGPVWSTAWFRLRGTVPAVGAGERLALRFDAGTEALLWRDGVPTQGFDVNRDTWLVDPAPAPGAAVDLLVEAACNRPLGATVFWWDPPGDRARWAGATPGRLARAELAAFRPGVWRLWSIYELVREIVLELPPDDPEPHHLLDALRRATVGLDDRNVAAGADAATALLEDALRGRAAAGASRCVAVGHAHIDTAWLWPIRETRRKCLRTFANVLRLMERFPAFRFLGSQAQQYAWVEADAPALFAAIAERVREGRWEAGGAMWVEPDANVPGGESLVRQILHGTRWWEARFGDHGRQRHVYLPDTFGFTAALPQIIAGAGLDTFITNKISWNQRNRFPHVTFRWRGLDGTEILAHLTPGHDYNARLSPAELRRGASNHATAEQGRTDVWLQPFGFGDGGGGPTDAMIRRAELAGDASGLPRVESGRADDFCAALHEQAARADLPVWDGELYLELHRGTYTTQAWLKRANRRAEIALRDAEIVTWAGPLAPDAEQTTTTAARLDRAWKLVLLNQFHDILPGTSIAAVYDDARRQHAEAKACTDDLIAAGDRAWAAALDTSGLTAPMLVTNTAAHARDGIVACDGRLHPVRGVPGLGAMVVDRAADPPPPAHPARAEGRTLTNGLVTAAVDDAGRLASLRHEGLGREAAAGPLNQLVLYEDRPRAWEAWDIDPEYGEKAMPVTDPAERIAVGDDGPWRATIEVERPLGAASRLRQRYVLHADALRLDVETEIDWHEDRRLLRALFPVAVRARRATYEIQFGHLERPTHRNTSWDEARYEVCAHRWADLAEPGFGVALLNDGKYGHSCDGHLLGLSLLRACAFPDPGADRGPHAFTYALLAHGGDWRAAGVDRAADDLNAPLRALALDPGAASTRGRAWTPLTLEGPAAPGVIVAALKRAEDDDRLVLRLVETHGRRGTLRVRWHVPVGDVAAVDLRERPAAPAGVAHDDATATTTCEMRPFEIRTLAAARRR